MYIYKPDFVKGDNMLWTTDMWDRWTVQLDRRMTRQITMGPPQSRALDEKKSLHIVCNLTPNTDDHGKIWSHFIIKGLLNSVQQTEIKAYIYIILISKRSFQKQFEKFFNIRYVTDLQYL